jgi:DNA invertase Pin-like site-specific DNA recombinase
MKIKTRSLTAGLVDGRPSRLVAVKRVSQRMGREGDAFISPAVQVKTVDAWATANNAAIVAWFDETDSVSGGTVDRVGLNAAVAMALSGEADGLIVATTDRFARTLEGGLQTIRTLKEAGRRFIAVKDNVDTARSTPVSDLIMHVMLSLAQWQRDQLKLGWESTRQAHVSNGVANHCPFGYVKGGDRRLAPDPLLAGWVVHIFERKAAGDSLVAIADDLTGAGVPTPTRAVHDRWVAGGRIGKEPPVGGDAWLAKQIRDMLNRRTYLGELQSGDPDSSVADAVGYANTDAHPPIIPVDLWQRVHQTSKTPAKRDKPAAVLAGSVRCGLCGSRMREITNHLSPSRRTRLKREQTYRYYRCFKTFSWGKCKGVGIRADRLETYALDQFEREHLRSTVRPSDVADAERIAAEESLLEAKARVATFYELPSTLAIDDDELLAAKQAPLLKAVETAKAAVAALRHRDVAVALPADLRETWPALRAAIERGDRSKNEAARNVLTLAYPAIVVWPAAGSAAIEDRVHIFSENTMPADLPGRGERVPSACRPIERPVGRRPAGARV